MKGRKGNLILMVMAAWICITGAFLYSMEMDTRREEKLLAQTTAKAFFQQLVVNRQWNASHGGVYVPITPDTPPNPYLQIENRDLTADNGLKLTKINPSYMTRQIAELAQKNGLDIKFHLTSLNPIRPGNKATDWEARWLKSFQEGVQEQGAFFDDGKNELFRYMAPLPTGPECLQCHAAQGYKEGDIHGGLSITLPYPEHSHFFLVIGYVAVAVIGLILIYLGGSFYGRKLRLLEATFNSPVPTSVTDTNFTILMANESYWNAFGPPPEKQKPIKCFAHRPGKSCHTEECPMTKIINGSDQYSYESIKEINGVCRHFIVTAKPLLDGRGKVTGSVESFQDITQRKQAEVALAESNRKLEALSNTDGLTGIANRRRFDEVLAQEYARHARSGADMSLILLDIDHFKAFNDCYGHLKGDECLQEIAAIINTCANRPADLAARYGGEEFACILPETGRGGAIAVAENIRQSIIDLAIPHRDSKVAKYVTASLGVATVQCNSDESVLEIVGLVDELLYQAKSAGRNRLEFSAPHHIDEKIKGNIMQLAWKDSFSSGNHLIDSQHQILFDTSNKLLTAVLSAHPAAEIATIISQLLNEVSRHFNDEEKILASIGFPDLPGHAAEHAKLLAKGHKLARQFSENTLTEGDLFQFVASEVVMHHLLEADRKYFPFINQAVTNTPEAT